MPPLSPRAAKALQQRCQQLYQSALEHQAAGQALCQLEWAAASCRRAIAVNPADANAHYNLSTVLLSRGQLRQGFREHEWRWEFPVMKQARQFLGAPQWDGTPGDGGTLLVFPEQGLGDTLQFCRFAPMAAARGWRVVLAVQQPLLRLLTGMAGVQRVVPWPADIGVYDRHCPMLSLPTALGTDLDSIPAAPYLRADPAMADAWRRRLTAEHGTAPRIGVVWAAAARPLPELQEVDRRRSLPPDLLAPLFPIPGLRFFSLQKGVPPAPPQFPLIDHMADMDDFADTAALVDALDLVISVDTSMVHLAGGMGKPVWMLDRFSPCWRWLEGRDDSPWYPRMRIFRQTAPGDWPAVIRRVADALAGFGRPDAAPPVRRPADDLALVVQLNDRGSRLRDDNRILPATALFRRAVTLMPGAAELQTNLASVLIAGGRLDEAQTACRRAIAEKPGFAIAHFYLGLTLLAKGALPAGWREYEWRLAGMEAKAAAPHLAGRWWRGEAGNGRTLLIHAEQGLGDTLQFCRYVPLAAARGWRVVLEVQAPLRRLLSGLAEVVIAEGDPLPTHDRVCFLMSLPLIFGTDLATIPAIPALRPTGVEAWRRRLEAGGRLTVGLAWAGNPRPDSPALNAIDRRRSLAPALLAPLFRHRNIDFFSLQKGGPAAPAEFPLVDHMAEMTDLADTAAFIGALDLVISVDSAVAHLAASLGRPVWLLDRFDACWRWLRDRDDSPWYPGLRIFRQTTAGDWPAVIERVAAALAAPTLNIGGSP